MSPIVVILGIYFLPSIIAILRNHQDWLAIVFLNLFLGWTLFGWFKALLWSGTTPRIRVKLED